MEEAARSRHEQAAGGVEAQEEHARTSAGGRIRPDIDLRRGRQPWEREQATGPDARHAEGDDPEPGLPIEQVQLHSGRQTRPQQLRVHRPVGEQQVVPDLGHDPRAFRPRQNPARRMMDRGSARTTSMTQRQIGGA